MRFRSVVHGLALWLATACGDSADPSSGGSAGNAQGGSAGNAQGGSAGNAQGGSGGNAADCVPGENACVANDVVECLPNGDFGDVVESCTLGFCVDGACSSACDLAAATPSSLGCVFWAADLDQQDGIGSDPASAPWGIVVSSASGLTAEVVVERNSAPVGQAPVLVPVQTLSLAAGEAATVTLPTSELDCGVAPNSYDAPGTCLSSRGFRITSSAPIGVVQLNGIAPGASNDSALLLPSSALGSEYRILGWRPGHPVPIQFNGTIIDRSFITVVGTQPDTQVTVTPTWKLRGNAPVAATAAGTSLVVTLQPFDVLNLETDDATNADPPASSSDLSGSTVSANKPIAVFSGTESAQVPDYVAVPTYPGWDDNTCCLDHLEEQLAPIDLWGSDYFVARSPVRSTGLYQEPDVIRFVTAEAVTINTSLPAPDDVIVLEADQVYTTFADADFTASGDAPFAVSQLLVSGGLVQGSPFGDPSLLLLPPVSQFGGDYTVQAGNGWTQQWVVITEQEGSSVTLDGMSTAACASSPSVDLNGVNYLSRRCLLTPGTHTLTGSPPFAVAVYGYSGFSSYAHLAGWNSTAFD